jgi:DNA-binding transcriptional LysR family regulator
MKLEDIHAFVAVVRYQSVTGAAEALLMRQPAISRRVQSLEKDLGVTLLDRQIKPTRPTPLGVRVFEKCEAVLRDLQQIQDMVRDDTPPAGNLRLGVSEMIAEIALLDAMPQVREHAPTLNVEVMSGWSIDMVSKLQDGELDAITVLLPETVKIDPAFSATIIAKLPMTVVAHKDALPADHYKLADLDGMGWILNPQGCGFRAGLFRAFEDRGMPLKVNLGVFGIELKLGMVAQGMGLGLAPESMIDASAYASQLKRIVIDDFQPNSYVWRMHQPALGNLQSAVTCFNDAIVGGLGRLDKDTAPAAATLAGDAP